MATDLVFLVIVMCANKSLTKHIHCFSRNGNSHDDFSCKPFKIQMDPKQVELSEVFSAVYKLSGSIFNFDDVYSFLSLMDLKKHNSTRFICWMIVFEIVSPNPEKWPRRLLELYQKYLFNIQQHLFGHELSPLSQVDHKSSVIIDADVTRSYATFMKMAQDLKLTDYYTKDVELRGFRIFSLLTLKKKGFSYTQGYDRYLYVCFCITLVFCAQGGLAPQFAEAMTYYLCKKFIKMVSINTYLDNAKVTTDYFEELDQDIAKLTPEVYKLLESSGHSSIQFALRWELLLFADEYKIESLLLLWDQILIRKDSFKDFLRALCLAHVIQVPPAQRGEIMVEKIQNYREWNSYQILEDALQIMNKSEKSRLRFTQITTILIFILFFFLRYYLFVLK